MVRRRTNELRTQNSDPFSADLALGQQRFQTIAGILKHPYESLCLFQATKESDKFYGEAITFPIAVRVPVKSSDQ